MIRSTYKSALALVAASGLAISACSAPGRLPAVPVASIPQTTEALGSVRYLVTRESKTFADDANAALAREQCAMREP